MTWTKLGDEYPDAARDLSDAAFRTHTEALCWSNRRLLDLAVPKRDLKRFAETDDPETAVKELIAGGWWQDCGDMWWIGCRFSEWQIERSVIEHRRTVSAETSRRHRLHKAGDHSLCNPDRCKASRDASRQVSPGTGRDGTVREQDARTTEVGTHDPVCACGAPLWHRESQQLGTCATCRQDIA